MGTRGYYVFKHKGMYYIFYNHFDSYFHGLGKLIVDDIKKLIKNDKNWIETIKKLIDKIKLCDTEIWGKTQFKSIHESLEQSDNYTYHTSMNEPSLTIFIEYIYIIDIDLMKFKIIPSSYSGCNTKVFLLTSIPDNWDKLCAVDSEDCLEQAEYYQFQNSEQDDKYNKIIEMMSRMMNKIERLEKLIEK